MPTCTPIYGLTYAICSDRPCDIGDTFCEFANQVETELDRLDGIVDRSVDTVPQARVRLTIPRQQGTNPGGGTLVLVPFDTVDVDTANMVDLVSDPFTITLPRFGVYFIHFNVEGTTAGAGNFITASGRTGGGGFQGQVASQLYLDDGSPLFLSSSGIFRYQPSIPPGTGGYTTTDPRIALSVSASAVVTPITSVTFGIHWMRDLS